MTTLALTAVGSTGRETSLWTVLDLVESQTRRWSTYVALAADHLIAVVLGGKGLQRRLDDTTAQTENQMQGRLL